MQIYSGNPNVGENGFVVVLKATEQFNHFHTNDIYIKSIFLVHESREMIPMSY